MRAGRYPFPEGKPLVLPVGGQVSSPVRRPNRAVDERYATDDDG